MDMSRTALPIPGLLWGLRPERRVTVPGVAERATRWCITLGDRVSAWRQRDDTRFVAAVQAEAQALPATGLDAMELQLLRARLRRHGLVRASIISALAQVSVLARSTLGLKPFPSQLIAARAVLEGRLAEMAAGEGKTLAVGLAAAVAGLAGMPVHVITASDYLVTRDAARLEPLYRALGLSLGTVTQADNYTVRSRAYACSLTYVTARELVSDYLRDSQVEDRPREPGAPPQRVLRGLCMAIIDDADTVLLDEARAPLTLTQAVGHAAAVRRAQQALRFARELCPEQHYDIDAARQQVCLTESGSLWLERATALADRSDLVDLSPIWRHRRHREQAVCTALTALHLYERNRHYLVRNGRVQVIDDAIGLIADGRAWSQGLQQFIELKEGCRPSPVLTTLAQITYQRFFPRYVRLGGLSSALAEVRAELLSCYGLSVRRVPLRGPDRRQIGAHELYPDHQALWTAVARRVLLLNRHGRPVLVATDSVAEAQALSTQLRRISLPHVVLHARGDAAEADAVARAGRSGAVTITARMAARGTGIELGHGVVELGGLHVLSCQLNPARRLDRQLAGRSARQGDPGSVETWLSLNTQLLAATLPPWLQELLAPLCRSMPSPLVRTLARWAQRREERVQRRQRVRLRRQALPLERHSARTDRSELSGQTLAPELPS